MSKKNNLKTIAYHTVLNGIISGEYKANQIISERELIEKLSISKSPVREALTILCNENVLRSIPRCGYQVVQLSMAEVQNILDYRYVLESGMLRFCFYKITQEQVQSMQELLDSFDVTSEDVWQHWEHNIAFHLALISCAQNPYAYEQLQRTADILKRIYAQFYWNRWEQNFDPHDLRYHQHILNDIKAGKLEEAIEHLRLDFLDFKMI